MPTPTPTPKPQPPARANARTVAVWLALCTPCVAGFEGVRYYIYYDIGGIPTYCFGETTPTTQREFTPEQCKTFLSTRLERDFGPAVDNCITHPLPPSRKAAYASAAYNIGIGAFCRSSMVRKENAGDTRGACDALMLYNKINVHGVLVYSPGLNNRRTEERKLCLS